MQCCLNPNKIPQCLLILCFKVDKFPLQSLQPDKSQCPITTAQVSTVHVISWWVVMWHLLEPGICPTVTNSVEKIAKSEYYKVLRG